MFFESLETRQLLSAGPQLVGIQLVGPVHAVSAVVLTFNQALDPATAQDIQAYRMGRIPPSSSDNGIDLGGFLPFASTRHKERGVVGGRIRIAAAVYDDAAHTVTLNPSFTFKAEKFFRFLRVNGQGAHGIKDPAGNYLDGNYDGMAGGDFIVRWTSHHGKRVSYRDADGDRVTLAVHGPGQVFAILRRNADPAPFVFLDRTNASTSTLTATIQQAPTGDGKSIITELSGASSVQTDLLSNGAFQILSVIP